VEKATTVEVIPAGLPKPGSVDPALFNNATIPKRSLTASYGYNWGDVRISHRSYTSFATSTSFIYDSTAGLGTWIYVVDTGVLLNHAVRITRTMCNT